MDLPAIKALAQRQKYRKAHIDREKGHIYYHGQRVANTTLQLRRAILPKDASRDEILSVAAWFHDIGKGIKPHANNRSCIGKGVVAGAYLAA